MNDVTPPAKGHGFGTSPVFLASISTILGAILFLRFGYAVGHVGLLGALAIILIGHAVTIPTGLAVSEIATNLKVEGGGAYFIISRSFGKVVGGAIGTTLYLSQAISVAFYMIAMSIAFQPLLDLVYEHYGFLPDTRLISIPATLILIVILLRKGAQLGVSVLVVVTAILALSLVFFFLGTPLDSSGSIDLIARVDNPDDFFKVFAIVFPAFTGMIAGIGLSGDLANPRKSIPLGTMTATLFGMAVYILVVFKLAYSATPEQLAGDELIMGKISLWGPAILLGLGAASLSSAIGSFLVAPRTLQALAADGVLPGENLGRMLAQGRGKTNEPLNATLLTSVIVLFFLSLGSIDFVAQIISMFFMITYGTLCAISFIEHFAGNPSYRPTFKTKWYLSLLGAVASFWMMFKMQPFFAAVAVILMGLTYLGIKRSTDEEQDLAASVQGALFQLTRWLQVVTQKKQSGSTSTVYWRPSLIAISSSSRNRLAPFELTRWICHHFGFGTYMHFIKKPLAEESKREAVEFYADLIKQTELSRANIYVNTIISPSFISAVAQLVQTPGISGMKNNSILFEFTQKDTSELPEIIQGCNYAALAGFNICLLRSGERHFGYKTDIHLWLTPGDFSNATVMLLLSYIILGHPEWSRGKIKLFTAIRENNVDVQLKRLNRLIDQGRIPISHSNVHCVPLSPDTPFDEVVSQYSHKADLVIAGLSVAKLIRDEGSFLKGFDGISDILFIQAGQHLRITDELEEELILTDEDVVAEQERKVAEEDESSNSSDEAVGGMSHTDGEGEKGEKPSEG